MKACNKDTTRRNAKIISLHASGWKNPDIARHIGLTRSRTWQIVKRTRERELSHQRGAELRKQLQEANDLTLKMSLDDFLCAMSLENSMGIRLKWHFLNKGIKELSLNDFMEFLIPETGVLTGLDTSIPAYVAHRIHHKSYARIISGVNQVDLGKAFNESWSKRKARLKAVLIAINHPAPYRQGRVAENTLSRDGRRIPTMQQFFGSQRLSLITTSDIEKYVGSRKRDGMSPRTINLEINLLSSIFQYAVSQGYAYENPVTAIKRLKTTQVELIIPSAAEFRSLIEGALRTEVRLELATWITFRGYTGTRPTESFFMEWRDIDFERDQVVIRPKKGNPLKNGKARYLPLGQRQLLFPLTTTIITHHVDTY